MVFHCTVNQASCTCLLHLLVNATQTAEFILVLQAMYPMHDMIRGKVFHAPPPNADLFSSMPAVHLISRTPLGRGPLGRAAGGRCRAGETERLDLELNLPQPGVGVLNVIGNIQGWSFSDPLPKSFAKVP